MKKGKSMEKLKSKNGVFYVIISFFAIAGIVGAVRAYSLSQNVNVSGDYNYYESQGQPENLDLELGAFPGPDIYQDVNIYGNLTTGSSQYQATTTQVGSGTYTMTFKDLNTYSYIDIMNDVADNSNLSFTLPATSTMMQLLPKVGSTREWLFHNATPTENTLTLVKGAGMDLIAVTANDDVIDADFKAEDDKK